MALRSWDVMAPDLQPSQGLRSARRARRTLEATMRSAPTLALVVSLLLFNGANALTARASEIQSTTPAPLSPATAACTSSVGPGIPPPASVPSGVSGFHASWYGQSGYMTLCPGDTMTATVAMYN